ncbi:MAG: UDP-N-acetylmuramate dehydrogenase [Pseudohongiellaceae bacterium]
MLSVEADKDLCGATTFGVPARCEYYAQADSVETLRDAIGLARTRGLSWRVLGEGSNVLLTGNVPGMIIRIAIPGIRFESVGDDSFLIRAGAGVNWHTLVRTCLDRDLYGLENLALIPGSVGAAPVQNIGAYGVELSDLFESVEVLDGVTGQLRTLYADDCRFGYRDSVFKQELAGRYVVTQLAVRLSTVPDPVLRYPALTAALAEHDLTPTPRHVFDAVCAIRRSKLPDPERIGNAGSFFRNPVLSRARYGALQERLQSRHGALPFFPVPGSDAVKVPAAWLIEQAGWKGFRDGDAGVHDRQALVLVNHGRATGEEIARLARRIADDVAEQFDVRLEPEVRIL